MFSWFEALLYNLHPFFLNIFYEIIRKLDPCSLITTATEKKQYIHNPVFDVPKKKVTVRLLFCCLPKNTFETKVYQQLSNHFRAQGWTTLLLQNTDVSQRN